jgi:hypothetical protein
LALVFAAGYASDLLFATLNKVVGAFSTPALQWNQWAPGVTQNPLPLGTASSNPVPSSEESGANCASAVIDVAILHRRYRAFTRCGPSPERPVASKLALSRSK